MALGESGVQARAFQKHVAVRHWGGAQGLNVNTKSAVELKQPSLKSSQRLNNRARNFEQSL